MYFRALKVCAIMTHTLCTELFVFEETFAVRTDHFCCCELRCSKAEWILLPCLFRSFNPGCAPLNGMAHTYRARKLVMDKTFPQSRKLFFSLWPELFQDWVCFTPLCVSTFKLWVCDIPGVYLLLVFKEIFAQTVFAVVNCAVVGLSVFCSLVLTFSLIFLQLWLLGHSVECILHLYRQLERW